MNREELKQKLSCIISNTNTTGNQKLDQILALFNNKALGINSCASLIKSMPIDQAIQIMKSDLTGKPQTEVIEGELVVSIEV